MTEKNKGKLRSLIGFPWYNDESLSEQEASHIIQNIRREAQRRDVLPIFLFIVGCLIFAGLLFLR